MIASLRGTVLAIELDRAVIECGGVGYLFLATPPTLGSLRRGEEATVLTSLAVKEDSMTLYGFTQTEHREMFHLLQTVTGLGPKLALAALSVMDPEDLARHIGGSDYKALTAIPGVGKRMAERLVVELKDKVGSFAGSADATTTSAASPVTGTAVAVVDKVVEALQGLGFSEKDARPAVEAIATQQEDALRAGELSMSAILKDSLAYLGKK